MTFLATIYALSVVLSWALVRYIYKKDGDDPDLSAAVAVFIPVVNTMIVVSLICGILEDKGARLAKKFFLL